MATPRTRRTAEAKAALALGVSQRKVTALAKRMAVARKVMDTLQVEMDTQLAERDYLGNHPALRAAMKKQDPKDGEVPEPFRQGVRA